MQHPKNTYSPITINLKSASIDDIELLALDRDSFLEFHMDEDLRLKYPNYREDEAAFFRHNESELIKVVNKVSADRGLRGGELTSFLKFVIYSARVRDLIVGLDSFKKDQLCIVESIFNHLPRDQGGYTGSIRDFLDEPIINQW